MNTSTAEPRVAGIYARISKSDSNVPKVENQIETCRKLCKRNDYTVYDTYADDGIAASENEARPEWQRLLADLEAGHIDVIVSTEPERMSRNNPETQLVIVSCVAVGAVYHTERGGYVDPSTAGGEFMATMFGAVGRMESKRKAERQREANKALRAKGKTITTCPRPFGWQDDRVTLDEAQAELIKAGITAIRSSAKVHTVLEMFRASGVKPPRAKAWGRISVINMLTRWRNAGVVSFKDEPTDVIGEWQPICTRTEIEEVRVILLATKGTRQAASYLCTGLAQCHCGATMIASGANGATYYQCSSRVRGTGVAGEGHTGIAVHNLDPLVRRAVIDCYFYAPQAGQGKQDEAQHLSTVSEALTTVHGQMEKLLAVYLDADTKMSKQQFTKANAELATRKAQLDADISRLAAASAHTRMLVELRQKMFVGRKINLNAAVEAKKELGRVFDSMTLDERRQLVAANLTIEVAKGYGTRRVTITGAGLPQDEDLPMY